MIMAKLACACCGYLTLDQERGDYEICDICFWEDCPVQFANPRFPVGPNHLSLLEAQTNFQQFGASDEASRAHVRPVTADDERDLEVLADVSRRASHGPSGGLPLDYFNMACKS